MVSGLVFSFDCQTETTRHSFRLNAIFSVTGIFDDHHLLDYFVEEKFNYFCNTRLYAFSTHFFQSLIVIV